MQCLLRASIMTLEEVRPSGRSHNSFKSVLLHTLKVTSKTPSTCMYIVHLNQEPCLAIIWARQFVLLGSLRPYRLLDPSGVLRILWPRDKSYFIKCRNLFIHYLHPQGAFCMFDGCTSYGWVSGLLYFQYTLYMLALLTKYTYDIHYKCIECVCRAAPGCRLSCHALSKKCVREGGDPRATLLNVQYTCWWYSTSKLWTSFRWVLIPQLI